MCKPSSSATNSRDEQLGALVAQLVAHPDATIAQHRQWWGKQQGQWVSQSMMWRAIDRAGWTRKKKPVGAKERDVVARLLFSDLAQTLDARRVVVVDESGTHLDMTRLYARAPRGARVVDSVLRNYGSNIRLIAALRLSGMTAPFVIEGAVITAVFEAYTAHVLAPTLQPGDIVVLDTLSCHKTLAGRHLIEARGASILFLPAYSPDLSPIEQAFAKLKQFLRRVNALTFAALLEALAAALPSISPLDAIGFFTDCGFFNIR